MEVKWLGSGLAGNEEDFSEGVMLEPGTGGVQFQLKEREGRREGLQSEVQEKACRLGNPAGSPAWGWWYEHGERLLLTPCWPLHLFLAPAATLPGHTLYSCGSSPSCSFCFILSIKTHINAWHIYTDLCIVSLPLKCKPHRAKGFCFG